MKFHYKKRKSVKILLSIFLLTILCILCYFYSAHNTDWNSCMITETVMESVRVRFLFVLPYDIEESYTSVENGKPSTSNRKPLCSSLDFLCSRILWSYSGTVMCMDPAARADNIKREIPIYTHTRASILPGTIRLREIC